MNDSYIVKKIYIPVQDSTIGAIALKIIHNTEDEISYFGIGEDDWIIKNGAIIDSDADILKYLRG
jgi:hypothetical protein